MAAFMELVYESSPKHKEPWQRGRKGTLCPHGQGLCPAKMLQDSIREGDTRYAVHNGVAYASHRHHVADGKEFWHGYPEAWVKVPEHIRRRWLRENRVKQSMLRRYWTEDNLGDLA
jgi:hypothetical protein